MRTLAQKRIDDPQASPEQFDKFIEVLSSTEATMREAALIAGLDRPEEVPFWSPHSELGKAVDRAIARRNQSVEEWIEATAWRRRGRRDS